MLTSLVVALSAQQEFLTFASCTPSAAHRDGNLASANLISSLLAVFGCPHMFHLLRCVSPCVKYFHQTGEIASVCSLEFPQGATDCVTRGQTLLEDEVTDVKQAFIREHEARNAWRISHALAHGLHFRANLVWPHPSPRKGNANRGSCRCTGARIPIGATDRSLMLQVQRVRVHRRTALHLKEVTHRSTSLYAVEVLLRLIRATLVRLVHHIQFQEHRLNLHRMDLGCLVGVGRIAPSHVHLKARHAFPFGVVIHVCGHVLAH